MDSKRIDTSLLETWDKQSRVNKVIQLFMILGSKTSYQFDHLLQRTQQF